MKERITITLDKDLIKEIDEKVDGFLVKNRSHAIETYLFKVLGVNKIRKAVILSGGQSKKIQALVKINDQFVIEHILELLKRYGVTEVIVILNDSRQRIREILGDGSRYDLTITYVQESMPLGTAGALRLVTKFLTEPFIVTNDDELKDIDLKEMFKEHKAKRSIATIALTTVSDTSKYGVARMKGSNILEFVEKPKRDAPSNLINSGLYIFEPEIIDMIPDGFSMLEKNIFPKLAEKNQLHGFISAGQWFDVNTKESIEIAQKKWKNVG